MNMKNKKYINAIAISCVALYFVYSRVSFYYYKKLDRDLDILCKKENVREQQKANTEQTNKFEDSPMSTGSQKYPKNWWNSILQG